MDTKQLLKQWQQSARRDTEKLPYQIKLPLPHAAQVQALADLFPGRQPEQFIEELVCTALDEIEEHFPYVKGKYIGEDENDDPVYDDAGLTPRFIELTRHHLQRLKDESR